MDLHRTSLLNQMDYGGGDHGDDDDDDGAAASAKEGTMKPGLQATTEERLDSGLDSLKEEEYQAVAAELTRLRVGSADCCVPPPQHRQHAASAEQQPHDHDSWKTHVTEDGDTLLHLAIIHEAKDCIRNMIDLSRNTHFLNTQNDQRQTPLHLAVITEQPEVCERLLVSGCDVALVDDGGDSPLHIACRRGNLHCFSVLTQNCPSEQLKGVMAACNYQGQNCLHLASINGFLHLAESLVALGADINAQEQCNGRTALHLAVDQQNASLVRLLLRAGADPNHLTYGGHSPFHLTYGRGDDSIRKELYPLTNPELRELPDSESEDSEEEEDEGQSDEEVGYDDIQWNGH